MFRTVRLSIIRSILLYTQRWFMSYRFADSLRAGSEWNWSCSQTVCKTVWHIPLLCVQWKTADDGQRNCPKHVEFYSKNKFEKLVHLVGFIVRIPERHILYFWLERFWGNQLRNFRYAYYNIKLFLNLKPFDGFLWKFLTFRLTWW
jgi:hypothetical protein